MAGAGDAIHHRYGRTPADHASGLAFPAKTRRCAAGSPPAPMLWNWNLINTGKLTFRVSQRDVKGCSVDYLRRLRGCPCAQLGTARARGPVSSRLRTGSSSTVSVFVSPLPELEVLCARLDSRVMGG